MAYAKFITRTNKDGRQVRYGPYYYRSVRTPDGRVRNIYLGSESGKGNENGKRANWIREALSRLNLL